MGQDKTQQRGHARLVQTRRHRRHAVGRSCSGKPSFAGISLSVTDRFGVGWMVKVVAAG
jgi:hypothetical protein